MGMPIHALLVHFPIALLIFGVLAQFIGFWKKEFFNRAALYLIISGFVMGVFSYLTGEAAEEFAEANGNEARIDALVDTHETLALMTLIIFGIFIVLQLWNRKKQVKLFIPLAIVLSIAGLTTLTLTGHYGGMMVYGGGQVTEFDDDFLDDLFEHDNKYDDD